MKRTKIIFGLAFIIGLLFFALQPNEVIRQQPDPINVVLISVDTLRADHLPCYGYPRKTESTFSDLSRKGVTFSQAYSQTSWTLPSHASMFTGLYPATHGAYNKYGMLVERQFRRPKYNALDERYETLAEIFRDQGYATAGFSRNPWFRRMFGLHQGFTEYVITDEMYEEAFKMMPRISEWIDTHKEERFFLFVHFQDPHCPYNARRPWIDEFITEGYKPEYETIFSVKEYNRYRNPKEPMPAADLERVVNLYDSEIAYVDRAIRIITDRLSELGLTKKTLVVLTSDHGEELMDHGAIGHDFTLYNEQIHIPLIFCLPGALPAGKVVDSVVEEVDIFSTILQMAGRPVPECSQGKSLIPLIEGREKRDRFFFGEKYNPDTEADNLKVYREGSLKLYAFEDADRRSLRYVLYDLDRDPRERTDFKAHYPGKGKRLLKKLALIQEQSRKMDAECFGKAAKATAVPNRELMEKLMGLGYLQGSGSVDETPASQE